MFAVVRHPDIKALGFVSEAALEQHRAAGWVRVSDWRNEPADFHLPDFAEAFTDLDAQEEQPKAPRPVGRPRARTATKEPAVPDEDVEEQQA